MAELPHYVTRRPDVAATHTPRTMRHESQRPKITQGPLVWGPPKAA